MDLSCWVEWIKRYILPYHIIWKKRNINPRILKFRFTVPSLALYVSFTNIRCWNIKYMEDEFKMIFHSSNVARYKWVSKRHGSARQNNSLSKQLQCACGIQTALTDGEGTYLFEQNFTYSSLLNYLCESWDCWGDWGFILFITRNKISYILAGWTLLRASPICRPHVFQILHFINLPDKDSSIKCLPSLELWNFLGVIRKI